MDQKSFSDGKWQNERENKMQQKLWVRKRKNSIE